MTAPAPSPADLRPAETPRFQRKRAAILDAAAVLINDRGTKGLSLADVADTVGLSTTSVTYYFRRKDQLAAACFARTLDVQDAMIEAAAREATPRARVRRVVALNFALYARIRRHEEPPYARLNDMRAMPDPWRAELIGRFNAGFRRVRTFFDAADTTGARIRATASTHVLLETMFSLPALLGNYGLDDYPRVEHRLCELLEAGFAAAGTPWAPRPLTVVDEEAEPGGRGFLLAATRLINERGYRGASVERIASELNVTKGSFYHHLDTKDDLVLACFRRSLATISATQKAAIAASADHLDRLTSAIGSLLEVQFSDRGPLLRSTALEALPPEMRSKVVDRQDRVTRRLAGMMIDAISARAITAIDPVIAARTVMAMINAAYELHGWAATMPTERAIAVYASTLFHGLFDD